MDNRRTFVFENNNRTFDGYIDNRHIVAGAFVDDKDAAKDVAFSIMGYEVSPKVDYELTKEEMADNSKVRRFLWFDGIDYIPDMVKRCIINKSGDIEIPDDEINYSALAKYMQKYYMDDIKKISADDSSMEDPLVEDSLREARGKLLKSLKNHSEKVLETKNKPTTTKPNSVPIVNGVKHTVSSQSNQNPVSSVNFGTSNKYNHYIPEDAGFNAMGNGGIMQQDQNGDYYLDMNKLVKQESIDALHGKIVQGCQNHNVNNAIVNDPQEFANALRQSIGQSVLSQMQKFPPEIVSRLTNNDLANICNKTFDGIFAGDVNEINRRLTNSDEISRVMIKIMMDEFTPIISRITKEIEQERNQQAPPVEEPVMADNTKESVDSKEPAKDEPVVEEDILGDKPVDNTDLKTKYPILETVEKLLTYNNNRGIKFILDETSKLITAAVFSTAGTDDSVIDKASIIIDLEGSIFTPEPKFWTGIGGNDKPDVKACYELTTENLVKFRDGKPMQYLVKPAVAKLNRYVDIRTLFNLIGGNTEVDESLAGDIVTETKREIMPNDKINRNYSKSRGYFTGCKKLDENTFEFTVDFPENYPRNLGEEPTANGGTGTLVVKVTTSEKTTKNTITK